MYEDGQNNGGAPAGGYIKLMSGGNGRCRETAPQPSGKGVVLLSLQAHLGHVPNYKKIETFKSIVLSLEKRQMEETALMMKSPSRAPAGGSLSLDHPLVLAIFGILKIFSLTSHTSLEEYGNPLFTLGMKQVAWHLVGSQAC